MNIGSAMAEDWYASECGDLLKGSSLKIDLKGAQA